MATDSKASLSEKKIAEMTSDELSQLRVPVGFPGLPYPMAEVRKGSNGQMEHVVQVIESTHQPMVVPTEQSMERVNGILYRQMPTPSMMLMLRDLLAKIQPESKNRIMTVFGDASSGKSHLFRMVGGLTHPEGPIMVDCGGMNMRELFFRTVIDYGKGVKEQFEQRVENGRVQPSTLETLESEFPGSVVKNDGKTLINWDAIGQRRLEEDTTGKKGAAEDRGDAMIRGQKIMAAIYAKEGIDVQNNSFGIKTVPGEVFDSIRTGRPLFLDEFNKSKKGTLDKFQTFLEFANGQRDYVTINNDMAEAGEGDSPKTITVTRDDLKAGWHIGIAGNDATDGDTTQDLSISMEDRLKPHRIGEPELRDWKHRISQVWTGVPLVTLYNLFEDQAKAKPAEFAEWLVEVRKLGLNAQEQKAIPPHEIYFLQNFQETVQAINQYSGYQFERMKLSDPESELFNQKAYQDLADEVAMGSRKIRTSFRTVIDDYNQAVQSMPEVRPARTATLTLNLAEAFKGIDKTSIGQAAPGWHRFGANLVRKVQESIVNDTVNMPRTRAALIGLCEQNGIFPPDHKEAKLSPTMKPLPDLLKYDRLKDLGGSEELLEVRNVLMANLRGVYKNMQGDDDFIIPLENLGRALKSLQASGDASPKSFVLPNDDLNKVNGEPMIAGKALPNYELEDAASSKEYILADFRSALAALAVPEYSGQNRSRVWPAELMDFVADTPTDPADIEAFNTLQGKSKVGFDLTILAAAGSDKQEAYLYVIEDKVRDQMMVVGPEDVAPQLKSALSKNGISYVVKEDESSIQRINDFLADGAKVRGEKGQLVSGNTQQVIEGLIKAFSALCEIADVEQSDNDPNQMTVNKGSTLGQVIHRSTSRPAVFTNIVKPRTP
jgi:energy-coupling factor transporter ATP-binding protein EcfA2